MKTLKKTNLMEFNFDVRDNLKTLRKIKVKVKDFKIKNLNI